MSTRSDVPQLLVKAGLAVLDEEGSEGLTLRRIAARAGVSHAAPAHHFSGLAGLKTAIATRGFQDFLGDLTEARERVSANGSPFEILLTVNMAYIAFARTRHALFRLMFDQLPTTDPDLRKSALGSYFVMKELCQPFTTVVNCSAVETAVWALTHGYAALHMDNAYPPGSPVRLSSYEEALRLVVG